MSIAGADQTFGYPPNRHEVPELASLERPDLLSPLPKIERAILVLHTLHEAMCDLTLHATSPAAPEKEQFRRQLHLTGIANLKQTIEKACLQAALDVPRKCNDRIVDISIQVSAQTRMCLATRQAVFKDVVVIYKFLILNQKALCFAFSYDG